MTHLDNIVSRVIVLAKLPGNKRYEVAKEMRDHLDDLAEEVRAQGYDDKDAARIVRMRFSLFHRLLCSFQLASRFGQLRRGLQLMLGGSRRTWILELRRSVSWNHTRAWQVGIIARGR